MFHKKPLLNEDPLQENIDALYEELRSLDSFGPEYDAVTTQLTKLHALKVQPTKERVSKDTWALIAANFGGILAIVAYESTHVITSKALPFVKKLL